MHELANGKGRFPHVYSRFICYDWAVLVEILEAHTLQNQVGENGQDWVQVWSWRTLIRGTDHTHWESCVAIDLVLLQI